MHLNVKHWYETLSLTNSRAPDAFTATSSPPCWSCVTTPTLCLTSWAGGTTEVGRRLDSCCSCGGRRRRSCRSAETNMEGSQVNGILISLFWHFESSIVFLHLIYLSTYLIFEFKIPRGPSSVFNSRTTPSCRFLLTCRVQQCWSYQRTCGRRFTPSSAELVKQLLKNFKLQ